MADKRLSLIVDLVNKTEAGFKSLYANLDAAEKRTENTSRALKEIGVIGTAAFTAAGLATKKFLEDGAELESQTIAFTTMLGSAEKAATMLKQLTAFASKTPFEVQGIRDTAKQLLAMGISSEALLPTLKSLGDVAAGLSQPIQRIAYVFGQVRTTGKLMGGDLMQFTQAGVPLLETLADQYGKTTAEVREMISAGEVGFPDVARAMESMSSEGGKFFNMMENQSQSLNGQVSNLKDNMTKMSEQIGTALIPIAKEITQNLLAITTVITNWVTANPQLAKTIIEVTLALTGLMVVMGAYGLALPRIVTTMGLLQKAFSALTVVMTTQRSMSLIPLINSIKTGAVGAFVALRAAVIAMSNPMATISGLMTAFRGIMVAATAQMTAFATVMNLSIIGAIVAVSAATIYMMNEFVKASQEVGGFGNAFKLVWLQIKDVFFQVMEKITGGLADFLSAIPGLGGALADARDGFRAWSDEAVAGMGDIISSVHAVAPATTQMSTDVAGPMGDILSGYGDLSLAAKDSGDDAKKYFDSLVDGIAGIRDEIRSTYDDIKKATDDFNKSVGEENQSYEDDVVDTVATAQNKKLELQKQLKEAKKKDNDDDVQDIKDSIAEQDAIIKSYQKSRLDLDKEIAEKRKYLNMNELDQLTYDHQKKLEMMKEEYLTEQKQRLQKIVDLTNAHLQAMALVTADKQYTLEAELAKKVAFDTRLANEKAGLTTWMAQTQAMYTNYVSNINSALSKIKTSTGMSITTPATSSKSGARASGGAVQPGRTFLVGEKGPELFSPETYGRISANSALGSNLTVIFSNNTFMDENFQDKISQNIVKDLKQAIKVSVA